MGLSGGAAPGATGSATGSTTGGTPLRALVWGAGAIGGVIGAHLARAGHDITFVDADEAHVAAVREHGLRITGPIEAFTVRAPILTPAEAAGTWSWVLLAVKALHTERAAAQLAPRVAPDGCVVSLQNGLNEIAIAAAVGEARTLGAFVNFGADVLEPGVVQFAGRGAVVVGELDGAASARAARLVDALHAFEPGAETTANIWGYLWGKMGYGAMLFASALTDASIVDVLGDEGAQPALSALAQEVLEVAGARGAAPLGFNGFDPAAFARGGSEAARRASYEAMVAFNRRSAKTHSGVWRDLAVHHRQTETDAQFEPILRLADAAGIEVPHLRRLVELMHQVEQGARPRAWDNLSELRLPPREGTARAPAL